MPSTIWNAMYSTSAIKTSYLNNFVSLGLSATISSGTHRSGNTLEKVLTDHNSCCSNFYVDYSTMVSDHYPIMFDFLNENSALITNPVACSYSFNSASQLSAFVDSWLNFTFTNYPSTDSINDFYNHLYCTIPQVFSKKSKKRMSCPFHYSSNTMRCLNIKNTLQKGAVKNPTFHNLNNLEVAEISISQSVDFV